MTPPPKPSVTPGAARPTSALLLDGTFGPFFFGTLAIAAGVWFHNIAAAVVMFRLTGSAVMVGAVSVMQFAAPLVLSPWAGALSDRYDRRRLLITGQVIAALGSAMLWVWVGMVGVEGLPGGWPILAAALLIGLGFTVCVPAMQALLPALVEPPELGQGIALHSLTFNIGRAIGPALGAAILVGLGAAAAFGISTATWCFSLCTLLVIRPRPVELQRGDRSVLAGLRFVAAEPRLLLLLGGLASLGFAVDPVITLTPPFADLLGGDDGLVGILASAFGVGAVATILIIRRSGQRLGLGRLGTVGLALLGGGMVATAFAPTPPVAIATLALAGSGMLFATTGLTTQIHHLVPNHLKGRVMALWSMAFLGSRPFAALLNGALADHVSTRVAIAVAGSFALAAALVLRGGAARAAQSRAEGSAQ